MTQWYGFTDTDPILAYSLILTALACGVIEWILFLAICLTGHVGNFVVYKVVKAVGSLFIVAFVYATWVITPWCVTGVSTPPPLFPPTLPLTFSGNPPSLAPCTGKGFLWTLAFMRRSFSPLLPQQQCFQRCLSVLPAKACD